MAFRAPVYGQLGGLNEDVFGPPAPQPQQWGDVLGPAEPHNMAAWLREIAAGRTPTWSPSATEIRAYTSTASERDLALALSGRQRALERVAALQQEAAATGGLAEEQTRELNAQDNNAKTLGEVVNQATKQLEASGVISPRTLIPILNPDGTPSGFAANPFNPDGPIVNLENVSPDQRSRVAEAGLNRAATATRSSEASQRVMDQRETARRTADVLTRSQQAVAQIQQDTATRRANADLEIARARSGDVTLQESRQIMEQVAKADTEALKQNGEIAKQAVADLNANERTALMQFVENQKVGEDAREVFQKAIADKNALVASEDVEELKGRVSQQNVRDKGVADLVGKMWDSYVGSLKDMSIYPEGWFNAVKKAGRTQAYAREIPGLLAQLQPVTPDVEKLGEFAQKARGLFGPLEKPNYRPLADIAPEFVREPLPTADLRAASARTGDILTQAQAGTALTPPEMSYNPYSPGFTGTMANPRNVLAPTAPGEFQAPIAQGLEPPPEEPRAEPLPFEEPGMNPLDLLNQEAPDLTSDLGMDQQDLGEYTAPFAGGDPQADLAFYGPLIENAPDQALIPSLLNFMAGLNARDDVADNPEDVLQKEYDYAFAPFGSTYDLDPNDFGDLYSDNSVISDLFGEPDYGGIF